MLVLLMISSKSSLLSHKVVALVQKLPNRTSPIVFFQKMEEGKKHTGHSEVI